MQQPKKLMRLMAWTQTRRNIKEGSGISALLAGRRRDRF